MTRNDSRHLESHNAHHIPRHPHLTSAMPSIQSIFAPARCLFAPLRPSATSVSHHAHLQSPATATFSTSPPLAARKGRGPKKDQRIGRHLLLVSFQTLMNGSSTDCADTQLTTSFTTIRHHSLPSLSSSHAPTSPLLSSSFPPALDNTPRLAAVPRQAT
jgi:hypothetical protein